MFYLCGHLVFRNSNSTTRYIYLFSAECRWIFYCVLINFLIVDDPVAVSTARTKYIPGIISCTLISILLWFILLLTFNTVAPSTLLIAIS